MRQGITGILLSVIFLIKEGGTYYMDPESLFYLIGI